MRRRNEQGLAAPMVVALTALLVFVTLAGAVVGRVLVEQRRAAAAADLAALAGATAVQQGRPGCPVAEGTALSNGARLLDCRQRGADILVVVSTGAQLVGRSVTVQARAHAGPVTGPVPAPVTGPLSAPVPGRGS